MTKYKDLLVQNILPCQSKLNVEMVELSNCKFIRGIVANPDVYLDVDTIDEFIDFAKEHNVKELYGFPEMFDMDEMLITDKDFSDETIRVFTKTLLSEYKDELEDNWQFVYLITKLKEYECSLNDDDNEDYSEDLHSIAKSLDIELDDFEDEYTYDEALELYSPNKMVNKLLNDITNFNDSIPDEVFDLVKSLHISCVIDNVTYSTEICNDIDFDSTSQLVSLLSKYNKHYDDNIAKKIEFDKAQLLEEEKLIKLKEKTLDEFLNKVVTDETFTQLTNNALRLKFIENMFNTKSDYYELVTTLYNNGGLTKSKFSGILDEIALFAASNNIKLGKK